jgi:Cdc6-like AAA superfamily ATPase
MKNNNNNNDIINIFIMSLKTLERNPHLLLKKNIVLYGANGTGKTTVLTDILSIIKQFVPNVIAFAPTADDNNSLKDIIPDRLIKRIVTIEAISKAYTRQQESAAAYNNANDPEVLQSIFKRIAGVSHLAQEKNVILIKKIMDDKILKNINDPIEQNKQLEKINTKSIDILVNLYKSVIRPSTIVLNKMKLTDTEARALKFLDFNPHALFIFDDCASIFSKAFQNNEMIKNLFFMYRHAFITIIFTFQDDLGLESAFRKNASLSFFTTEQCANAYFERGSNHFTKSQRRAALHTSDIIFDQDKKIVPNHSKFLYIRGDPHPFRYFCANMHVKFQFGSNVLWAMCAEADKIKRAGVAVTSTFGKY